MKAMNANPENLANLFSVYRLTGIEYTRTSGTTLMQLEVKHLIS